MLGDRDVGIYSAAVRISSAFYFLPIVIGWSLQTAVVQAKNTNEDLYFDKLSKLFTAMALSAYLLILPISFFSKQIIMLLFGAHFEQAGAVLGVHIFASLFLFVGIVRGLWVTNESHMKFAMWANAGAGALNIILNYILIPRIGIMGAAYATLVSYFFTYVGAGLFFTPARKIVLMQIRAILLIDIYTRLRATKA